MKSAKTQQTKKMSNTSGKKGYNILASLPEAKIKGRHLKPEDVLIWYMPTIPAECKIVGKVTISDPDGIKMGPKTGFAWNKDKKKNEEDLLREEAAARGVRVLNNYYSTSDMTTKIDGKMGVTYTKYKTLWNDGGKLVKESVVALECPEEYIRDIKSGKKKLNWSDSIKSLLGQ